MQLLYIQFLCHIFQITKAAKKLKKEKISVDVVSFGEQNVNTEKLTNFINTLNGKDGGK